MICSRRQSKLFKYVHTILQRGKTTSTSGHVEPRKYQCAEKKDDDDIKWQWSVRESPCSTCHNYKKRGWFTKIFQGNNSEEELTNRHRIVEYKPKIWELEYYTYLMPGCQLKPSPRKQEGKPQYSKRPSNYSACAPQNFACKNKQLLVSLQKNDELKECTEKLDIPLKKPFCLNQVCGKTEPFKKVDIKTKKDEFFCLNDLIQSGNKGKSNRGVKGERKKDNC